MSPEDHKGKTFKRTSGVFFQYKHILCAIYFNYFPVKKISNLILKVLNCELRAIVHYLVNTIMTFSCNCIGKDKKQGTFDIQ